MAQKILLKLKRDPLGFIKRALHKVIIDPLYYRQAGGGYDAARYWGDRIGKYAGSLRGVGDEGFSEADNERQYQEAAQGFLSICQSLPLDLQQARILEVGPGTGFYTRLLHQLGAKTYLGVDITTVYFQQLQAQFPHFHFAQTDITSEAVIGQFDLIVMIDVIEHIVTAEKLTRCLATLDACLAPGGLFILAPLMPASQRHLFYVRFWSLAEVQMRLPTYGWARQLPFRGGQLHLLRKPDGLEAGQP